MFRLILLAGFSSSRRYLTAGEVMFERLYD